MLGKLLCAMLGHKRGKRVLISALSVYQKQAGLIVYQCPRCHATWERKNPKLEAPAAIPTSIKKAQP